MNVFRITRAEFAKVFKKPTVYIMAFILAVALVISLMTYTPILRQVKSVSIEGDNAMAVYNIFMSQSTTADTKDKFDEAYYNYVDNQINFYDRLYSRTNNLRSAYQALNSSYIKFSNTYTANNQDANLPSLMAEVKAKLNEIRLATGENNGSPR